MLVMYLKTTNFIPGTVWGRGRKELDLGISREVDENFLIWSNGKSDLRSGTTPRNKSSTSMYILIIIRLVLYNASSYNTVFIT